MVGEAKGNQAKRNIDAGEYLQREQGRSRETYAQIVRNNQNYKEVVENISNAKKIHLAHLEYRMEDE